jgi:hypothetical protein
MIDLTATNIDNDVATPYPYKALYFNKIHVEMIKKRNDTMFSVYDKMHNLIDMMFDYDNDMIKIGSITNNSLFIKHIGQYPGSKTAFYQFFDFQIINKPNGDTTMTTQFHMITHTPDSVYTMKQNYDFFTYLYTHDITMYEHCSPSQSLEKSNLYKDIKLLIQHNTTTYHMINNMTDMIKNMKVEIQSSPLHISNNNLPNDLTISNCIQQDPFIDISSTHHHQYNINQSKTSISNHAVIDTSQQLAKVDQHKILLNTIIQVKCLFLNSGDIHHRRSHHNTLR